MTIAVDIPARGILGQIVREPSFRALATIPTFAPITIGLIAFAYALFAVTSYGFLKGHVHWTVMILLNAFAIYCAFTPLHDAVHRTLSGNRRLNDLLGTVACFALLPGITTRIYRYLHLEHHRFAGDKLKDPDEPFVSARPLFLPFVLAAPDVIWTLWYMRRWNARPSSERAEFALGLSFYVLWHVVWLLSPYAYEFVVLWLIPQRVGISIVTYFFAHIQHPEGVRWEVAPFQATVMIKCNRWLRYLMLSQTEHAMHHLLPSIPFYRYHQAWEAGRHLFEAQDIPVRGFFTPAAESRPALWMDATVDAVWDVAQDVRAYELRPMAGKTLPAFSAGAHLDIQVAEGLVRQYSLCNSPRESGRYVIAVKSEPNGRGGSRAMHERVAAGQTVRISRPRNNFPLSACATYYTLVAGGIGITPLLSMAHELHERGAQFTLHVCARSEASLPFGTSLHELPFRARIKVHLDDGADDQKFVPERDLGPWRSRRDLYVCGPTGFMNFVIAGAKKAEWTDQSIFFETFVPAKPEAVENRQFEVELARSGKLLVVEPDQSLMDVLNANSPGLPFSCTQGICGSCITRVVAGIPDHRDAILTDAERAAGDKMCVCVGRARSARLVLDL